MYGAMQLDGRCVLAELLLDEWK
ncbi:hypothetical protein IL54_1606 [Sphingobium sp. ba1]|nr:hypothetical protein IL54_1606 [Sphingobium sp. ba1]